MALGSAQRRHVSLDAVLPYKAIRIEPSFERDHLHFEALFCEQRDRLLRRSSARQIRIEVDDDALGETAEQTYLHLGEGCA